jgi:hypothetical protein
MTLVRINRHPSRRQLAVFAALWVVCFGGWGALAAGREAWPAAWALWAAAGLVPTAAALVPGGLRAVYVGMMYAAAPVGLVVSVALIAALYYLVVTPIGLIVRAVGYDPMCRALERNRPSYWAERPADPPAAQYFRQS